MKNIYYNAVIHAKKDMDVEAMGVENGRVGFIGTHSEAKAWENGEDGVWHNMNGAFIVPGFIDSHLHLLQYGNQLSSPNLTENTSSMNAVVEELFAYKNRNHKKSGDWVVGSGWNQECFEGEKRLPNRYDLDQVSREQPVIAWRSCRHIACANSAALKAAGITRDTKNPEGGSIDFDEHGEPTGILRENAINLVSRFIPAPEVDEIKHDMVQAMKKLNSYGITSVQSDDFGAFPGVSYKTVIQAYEELEAEGLLTVKVYEQCLLDEKSDFKEFIEKGYRTGKGSAFFSIGPLKIIADGSLGARTALLSTPYADDKEHPDNCGIAIYSQQELDEMVSDASKHGMQVAVHAIGDKAMDMAARSMEKALGGNRNNPLRHGIVHCQITTKALLDTFQRWNLHAYIQSIFLEHDNHVVEKRLGEERAASTYAFKTFLDLGLDVSDGSDAPVEYPDVLAGIQCAVTRTTLDGTKTFLPDQSLSVEEALQTFTSMGARASFEEKEKGMLLPGMAADFTVLSQDIRRCLRRAIKDTKVCRTFVNGTCVYDSEESNNR